MVERENRVRFSPKEGKYIFAAQFLSGELIDCISLPGVDTEISATSVMRLIEVLRTPPAEVYRLFISFPDS